MAISTVTLLCYHHHHASPQTETPTPSNTDFHSPLPAPATTISLSASVNLTSLGASHNMSCSHTTFVPLCVRLISLSTVSSLVMRAVARIRISFLLEAEYDSIVRICYALFIHSPLGGNLGGFPASSVLERPPFVFSLILFF